MINLCVIDRRINLTLAIKKGRLPFKSEGCLEPLAQNGWTGKDTCSSGTNSMWQGKKSTNALSYLWQLGSIHIWVLKDYSKSTVSDYTVLSVKIMTWVLLYMVMTYGDYYLNIEYYHILMKLVFFIEQWLHKISCFHVQAYISSFNF